MDEHHGHGSDESHDHHHDLEDSDDDNINCFGNSHGGHGSKCSIFWHILKLNVLMGCNG